MQAQTVTVTGTVYDEAGDPVMGASVIAKGSSIGTATDIDGKFSLPGVKIGTEIRVTFVGCDPFTFKASNQPVTVTLKENAHNLDEVVVTALGMKREKKALGYSMTELKGDELNQSVINPVSALQGKVAGVDINQSDGGLFGSNRITIRGVSTLGKNNQPIYVVDGIILDNEQNDKEGDWDTNNSDYGNELKNLNPADFESVSVLKGAAATALYGSRALNGVVLITTKSGKGAKGYGVTFSQTFGCDWMIQSPKFQNEFGQGVMPAYGTYGVNTGAFNPNDGDKRDIRKRGYASYGWGDRFDGEPYIYYDGSVRPYVAQENNYKDAYRTGFNTTTNVAVTGGNEKTNFYSSIGYKYAQGIVDNNDFNRFNFLLKASHQISKTVNVEGGVTFANSTPRNSPINLGEYFTGGTFTRIYDASQRKLYKGSHGGLAQTAYGDEYGSLPGRSIWWSIYENDYKRKETVIRPNAKVTVTPTDWLRLVAEGSYNYYYTRSEGKNPGNGFKNEGGSYSLANSTKEQTNLNLTAYFNKDFNDWEFHAMARGEYFHSFVQAMSMSTKGGLSIPNKFFINNGKEGVDYSGTVSGTKTMWSAMAQVGASWKGQVYLDVTGRNDWSSALVYSDGHGTFSYFYPSISASWLINNTFKLPEWISFAKVRASWAQVGNDTAPYTINSAYVFDTGKHDGNNISAAEVPNTVYSTNLKPERKNSWEFGLDWRFFNNRFGIDLAYYKDNTTDQIMTIEVPSESGVKKQVINAGNIQNKGIELALNATPIQTKDWTWDLTFTYTKNDSKIIELHPYVTNYITLSGSPDYGNYRVGSVAKVGGAYGLIMTDSWAEVDETSGLEVLDWENDAKYAYKYRSATMKEVGVT